MFQKGVSGNPSGRAKNPFKEWIEFKTGSGKDLVDFALSVLKNEKEQTKTRLDALEWLADRGFGKAIQNTNVEFFGNEIIVKFKEAGNAKNI